MLTAMVAGLYESNDVYAPDIYSEFCFCIHDHLPCAFHGMTDNSVNNRIIQHHRELAAGPAALHLVSNNNPIPVPMSVQVPPGHVVQQVIDENGTLLHVVMPPQASVPLPLPTPYNNHRPNSNTGCTRGTSPFIAYPHPQLQPHSAHCQFHPPIHNSHPHLQTHLPSECIRCGGPYHMHQCSSFPSSPGPSCPSGSHSLLHKDERSQRQFHKLRKKLESKQKESNMDVFLPQSPSVSPKKDKSDPKMLNELLSNITQPNITNVSTESALVCWKSIDLCSAKEDKNVEECVIKESDVVYEVLLSDKGKEGTFKTVGKRKNQYQEILENLKPGTCYYVCIQAVFEGIAGNPSASSTFKTEASEPDTPLPPKLVTRTKTSLVLKWNASSDNGAKITGYVLEYDEGLGTDNFVEIFNGLQKNFKVTKLKVSTCYRFRLAAINEIGKSKYSEIICYSTSGSAPSQPLPPTLKEAFINQLSLEWQKRSCDEEFILQIEDEATELGFLPACNTPETSFVCTDLKRNTKYRFRLCASNEDGSSPWSKVVVYCTLPDKPSKPGSPQAKGHVHAHSFQVVWDAPVNDGGSPVNNYILELSEGNDFEVRYNGLQREYRLENLLPGTTYSLRVACQNVAGQSEYSDVSCITTATTCPGKCSSLRVNGKAKAHYCQIEWASPKYDGGSPITQFEVQMTSPDDSTRQAYIGHDSTCIIAGLSPNQLYLFKVRAYNKTGPGHWSDTLEVLSGAGVPDAPKIISLECSSSSSAKISWNEPNDNGAPIIEYCIESSQSEDNFTQILEILAKAQYMDDLRSKAKFNFPTNGDKKYGNTFPETVWIKEKPQKKNSVHKLYTGLSNPYKAENLCPAKMYFFRIQAVNSAGSGPHSEVVSCCTLPSTPGCISSSSIIANCTATTMILQWQEPENYGSDILQYNIEVDDLLYTTEGNVTEVFVEDLLPETTYRVRLQAVNGIGPGTYSSVLKVMTLCLPPSPPQLVCVAAHHNSLRLKWGEGKNTELLHYTLELENRSGSFVPIYQGINHVHKVHKLQEATCYNFRIYASNAAGTGEVSKIYSFFTTKSPPAALKAPRISDITQTSSKVEWQAAKSIGGDSFSYQLQLLGIQESEYKIVYQGTETTCNVENLEPHSTYAVRVDAIRHCHDNGENIPGAFSPSTTFTTLYQELISRTNSHREEQSTVLLKEKILFTDQQCAFIILGLFTLFAIIVAIMIENFWSCSTR